MMMMAEVPTEAVDMGEVRDDRIRRKRSYSVESFTEVCLIFIPVELKCFHSLKSQFNNNLNFF